MTEEAYNAADPKKVRKREQRAKDQQKQLAADFEALLDLPQFRRFLWHHMCDTCGLFRSTFSPNGSIMAKDLGRQSIGQELVAAVEAVNPKLIPQMMTEFAEWQK